MIGGGKTVVAWLAAIALVAIAAGARAEAFRPADPGLVLLRVPDAVGRLRTKPQSLAEALQRAAEHIEDGRRTGQPRGFGRAESILERWRTRATTSAQWYVLAADVQQYRHRYAPALSLLGRALSIEPGNPRALLMRAAIRQTQGDFEAARGDCAALMARAEAALGTTCLAQVIGLTGQLERAHDLLARQLEPRKDGLAPAVRVWMLGALADMAERRGDAREAQRALREALHLKPADPYLSLALADLLLAEEGGAQIEPLLRGLPATSGVLLRRAEARRRRGEPADALIAQLERMLAEARERGEQADLRELVRLRLLQSRPCEALRAAHANWSVQREPADVRLLLGAACACDDRATYEEIARWRAATRYEDARADVLLGEQGRS